jgi:alpha-1,2-mannosyltransferase
VSGTTVRPAAGSSHSASAHPLRLPFSLTPAGVVIVAATLLALGLRGYQLARPGHLLGVGDYDDGADFGSAIWLVHGVLPYRDFVLVQPPGITVLMAPAALLSKVASTAWAIAAGRMLTALAGTAAVVLGGLLVRHRGVLATLLTCGIIAIYPGSVQAAHTVLLEPWLTAFCLAGALAVFDGDRLASGWRLAWGGALLGFAGAIKVWAIIPVAVILVFCLRRPRQAARFVAGVAAGFVIPVLPFAVLAPRRFYDSVVVAQLARTGARIPLGFRLQYLTGMTGWLPGTAVFLTVAIVMAAVVAGTIAAAWRVTRRGPAPLEWFAVWTAVVVTVAFMVPVDFYYHYAAFLAPFLAMAFALPAARLMDAWQHPPAWLRKSVIPVTGLVILALPLAVPRAENSPTPTYSSALPAVERAIPRGACVLTDEVALLISADRFVSADPACPVVIDGTGTSYALGHGRNSFTAGSVPAVASVWRQAFHAARYVLITPYNSYRIAWTPELRTYFRTHFTRVSGDWAPLQLYARTRA